VLLAGCCKALHPAECSRCRALQQTFCILLHLEHGALTSDFCHGKEGHTPLMNAQQKSIAPEFDKTSSLMSLPGFRPLQQPSVMCVYVQVCVCVNCASVCVCVRVCACISVGCSRGTACSLLCAWARGERVVLWSTVLWSTDACGACSPPPSAFHPLTHLGWSSTLLPAQACFRSTLLSALCAFL